MTTAKRPSLVDQVHDALMDDLLEGRLEPGAKLPNENELAERYAVSRATVRESVLRLLEAGYLSRRHGSGTFVTHTPRTRHALDTTVSYTSMIREAGHEPGENVVSRAVREPTEVERSLLDLADGQSLIEVERVRLADGRPVIYSRDRIPESLLGAVARTPLDSSLYDILYGAGHPVASASAQLMPVLADKQLGRLLSIKPGTPLLHIDQVDYDDDGRAVMLSDEWHVADAFELIVNRRSSPSGGEG
ncbi:MAG: GntR family transcriptional regulator [Thermoleophilaceae bacterium]